MTARATLHAARAMTAGRMISSLFSVRLARAAHGRGVEAGAMWRVLGVEPRGPDFPLIDEQRHLALWAYVMRTLDDPGFPIAYAETMSIDDYGVLGLACKTAATLGDALAVVETYLPIYADLVTVRIVEAAVVLERAGAATLGHRCSVESGLAEIVAAMRQLVDGKLTPSAITFTHPRPRSVTAHTAHFGVAPQFAADRHAIELTPALLRQPLRRADRALHSFLVGELARLRASRTRADASWTDRARAEALRMLPRPLEIAAIARALGTSRRTLQRRLADEGTRFEAISDQARYELARALLDDRERTISEVALACGFADASSFARAYQRWAGCSPRADRQRDRA